MKSRALVIGLLATGLCGVAQAEGQGFYAGSGAGMYYVEVDDTSFDETATTLRVFGGYQLNPYVSFEAGYTKLFEASGNDVEFDGDAWEVSVRPSVPLAETFTAYAILGWTEYDIDVSVDLGPADVTVNNSDGDLHYGIGGAFSINDSWNVRGEWTTVDLDDVDFGMFSLSAVYNFQ